MFPPTERIVVNAVVALLQETDLPLERIADNRLDNLQLMTLAEHAKHHHPKGN